MPRTRSLAWSELKIGVLTIVAIAIAAVAIFMLTGGRGLFLAALQPEDALPNVAGLKSGSPVRVAGVEVGTRQGVELVGEQVDVRSRSNKEHAQPHHRQSIARLGSVSLLGESAVDITPIDQGHADSGLGLCPAGPHAEGARRTSPIRPARASTRSPGCVEDVRGGQRHGRQADDRRAAVRGAAAVRGDGWRDDARASRRAAARSASSLNDPKAAEALEASLKNVEEMTRRINAGEGSLGKLLKDEAFSRSR